MKTKTQKNDFKLIELLIVIAIIRTFTAILFPVFKSTRNSANKTDSSPNHDDEGQNVVYVDRHVEHITTPTAGCTFPDGSRNHIYLDTTLTSDTGTGGTDSVILHDG